MKKELKRLLQEQREQEMYHISMEKEFDFYRSIARGDIKVLEEKNMEDPEEGMGVLSRNALRNRKYHLIILIAMITRFCIEAGLDSEEGYTLSDMFIRRVDEERDEQNLQRIKREAITAFINIMHEYEKEKITALPVVKGMDFIQKHLTENITSRDVAVAVHSNPDYLSKLFKKETGLTLGQYILNRKCHAACYMLKNSQASITDISSFFGFASASYFIARFKSVMGVTPESYRKDTELLEETQ